MVSISQCPAASQGRQQLMPLASDGGTAGSGLGLTLGARHSIRLPAHLVVAPKERC